MTNDNSVEKDRHFKMLSEAISQGVFAVVHGIQLSIWALVFCVAFDLGARISVEIVLVTLLGGSIAAFLAWSSVFLRWSSVRPNWVINGIFVGTLALAAWLFFGWTIGNALRVVVVAFLCGFMTALIAWHVGLYLDNFVHRLENFVAGFLEGYAAWLTEKREREYEDAKQVLEKWKTELKNWNAGNEVNTMKDNQPKSSSTSQKEHP